MKKLTTFFTTMAITLALMMAAPSAMAKPESKDNGSNVAYFCHVLKAVGIIENLGQCVSLIKKSAG